MPAADNLIWIDLEMTGLRPEADDIIEIATLVTNAELELVEEGPVIAIHQDEAALARMDDWNQRQHGSSGLLARVRASRVGVAEAERQTIDFLARHVEAGRSPMCGNSICQDRRFLARHMPQLESFFHYRNLGADYGRVLVGVQVPPADAGRFQKFLADLGYPREEETGNPAYRLFLS